MRYEDESASTETLNAARRKAYTKDTVQFINRFEQLQIQADSRAARISSLESQLRRERKDGKQAAQRVVSLSSENKQLKTLVSALRGSKSMKLGRLISRPSVVVKQLGPLRNVGSRLNGRRNLGVKHKQEDCVSSTTLNETKRISARDTNHTYIVLQDEYQRDPSKKKLFKLLSHHYFERGDLSVPADLIRDNGDILSDLTLSEKSLVGKILGQSSLLENAPLLPPIQPNAGYFAERGRAMYCVHSTGDFDSNGYSTRTSGLVSGLASNEQEMIVVARPGYPWDSKSSGLPKMAERIVKVNDGVDFIYTPGPTIANGRLDHFISEAADVFVREATRNRVSVIHSASNYMTALPALIAARRLGLPFVYEVRGLWEITELSRNPNWEVSDRFKLAAKYEAFVASAADRVLAITSQVADALVKRGASDEKITLLPNAVDTNTFKPMPPYRDIVNRLGIDDESVVIGYAGSLVDYEGLAILLDSTKILLDRGRNIRIVIVGDGPELDNLKFQAAVLSISEYVVFTGRVPAIEIPDYISVFDIMPCPRLRLPITELVSPLKPLEIMASGKALVLSDLAPSRDLAGEKENRALLSEPGNAGSLADEIDRLIIDRELRGRLGKESRIWTVKERTWNKISRIAIETYQKVQGRELAVLARPLSDLNVAIIADEFTLAGIRPEVRAIELDPIGWREQFRVSSIDVLFVESAWSGNSGGWHRKVGYYDQESFSDLKDVVEHCRTSGIPTVFWNKEDPVHFNRFEATAAEFDCVFTTDSDCIAKYLDTENGRSKVVASLPFYAQPKLHNPLPGNRSYDHSVAYGGSFYGDKYKKRSRALAQILQSASAEGLTIYDRQHLNPDSPYKFPPSLQKYVVGGLAYPEMLNAYKSHPVHINVNSVDSSPTMFSRRVMEVAASGSAVLSGTGRGVSEVLGGIVPVISGADDTALLVSEWMVNETARIKDAWRSYRAVYRAHTAAHRLSYMFRSAGLVITAPELPQFAVYVPELNAVVVEELRRQTAEAAIIYYSLNKLSEIDFANHAMVSDFAEASNAARDSGVEWITEFDGFISDRTLFEDLLVPLAYGDWSVISVADRDLDERGIGLANSNSPLPMDVKFVRTSVQEKAHPALQLRRPIVRRLLSEELSIGPVSECKPRTVLIAGHDLKFASGIISELRSRGHAVLIDKWSGHGQHDVEISKELLSQADIILCEWSLGNAAWYSRHVEEGQRLIVRLHSQEVFTTYLHATDFSKVDKVIFVGQHIADIAIRDFDVPKELTRVIPNYVNLDLLKQQKVKDAEWNIGLVGIVPQGKRLDLALDLLCYLRERDGKYRLFVKGHGPEHYSWMKDRPEEMEFYEAQYERLRTDSRLANAVIFDPFDEDMSGWYSKIGTVISVSDFESFHLTLADGAASGALPLSLAWDGSDQIYPVEWLASSIEAMGDRLLEINSDSNRGVVTRGTAQSFVEEHFESVTVLSDLCEVILGDINR